MSDLPAAYEPDYLGKVDSIRDVATARAAAGAPEGTLLIADDENLEASVVLEPEVEEGRYHELLVVSLVSMGQAIAAEVSPMTALTYSRPNKINIAAHRIASQWLDHGKREDGQPWLALTASVNIARSSEDFSIAEMSLHEAEGNKEISAEIILVGWARQLIGHLNDWDTDGFAPVEKFWLDRLYEKESQ